MIMSMANNTVLLVCINHDQIRNWIPINITDNTVALINALLGRTLVARHRHPASVGNDPALFLLVSDDGTEHRKCNVRLCAYAQPAHDQIEKHINTREDFGYAFKDRKSVESGTSVSVRVDPGGRRIIKKKKKTNKTK